jgi:hypothetical protein
MPVGATTAGYHTPRQLGYGVHTFYLCNRYL